MLNGKYSESYLLITVLWAVGIKPIRGKNRTKRLFMKNLNFILITYGQVF
jgi:hypothetical protein